MNPGYFRVIAFLVAAICNLKAYDTKVIDSNKCPCKDPSLCKNIAGKSTEEVFAFAVSGQNFKKYDWNKMTTIILFSKAIGNKDLLCYAHSKNVRVSYGVGFPKSQLTNVTARQAWIDKQVDFIQQNFFDGVNLDYESSMGQTDRAGREGLNRLVEGLSLAVRKTMKYPQVTFDSPNSPIDTNRHFDYKFIAKSIDFILVMAYDEMGSCHTGGNADYPKTITGIKEFKSLGISGNKLVLGLPWYGYTYPCQSIDKENRCTIAPMCGGREIDHSSIMEVFQKYRTSDVLWDKNSRSPYFNYKDPTTGKDAQIWYDNARSLSQKYKLAPTYSLRGVGIWQIDSVNMSDTKEGERERQEMWGSLPSPTKRMKMAPRYHSMKTNNLL